MVQVSIVGGQLIATITDDAVVSPLPLPFTAATPPGSLIYRRTVNESIGTPTDNDAFTVELDGGTMFTAIVDPSSGLTPRIELRGRDGEIIAVHAASAPGRAVVVSGLAGEPGVYTISVSSAGGDVGHYKVRVVLNAAADLERYGGTANDSPAQAQDLTSTFSTLPGSTGDRGGLIVDAPPPALWQVIYSANMDVNPRWRLEGGWAYGQPTGGGSDSYGIDPTAGFTGQRVVGYNLSGNYPDNLLAAQYATVGPIDTRGFKDVTLSFYRWLGLGYGDIVSVQVSADGINWTTLQSFGDLGTNIRDFTWKQQEFDLSSVANNSPTVFVRWGLGPTNNFATAAGWNIDDVVITGTPLGPPDVDWYRFDLNDGQIAAVALTETASSAAGRPTLDLYDGNLNFLAGGVPSGAYSQLIDTYLDTTTNGMPDTYFLRVATPASTPYNLIVTRDALLEIEPNNRSSQAQLINAADTVLGHLGDGGTFLYRHDDGVDERASQRRDGGDILWLNSFTAQPGADRITAISLAWSTFVFEGEPTTVLLYDDPNDDGNPNDAVLLATAETNVFAPGIQTFTEVPITPTRVQGEFFVAALFSQKRSEIVAPLDSTLPARRSWFAGSATPGAFDIHNLAANSSPPVLNDVGNFLLRAVASPEETGEDWYRVLANVGDEIAVQTATPGGGPGQFINVLDPALEVFDPSGSLIAGDANSADGRNASLAFQAATTGSYRIRVAREAGTTGEYVLSVQGGSRENAPPEVETAAPDDNEMLAQFPAHYSLDLSEAIDLTTVEARDLVVGGRPALSVTPLDDHTLQFQVDPAANTGDGQYMVELSANALADIAGLGNLPYKGTFVLDTTPPRVIYSSIAEASTVAGSNATYTAIFSEPIDTHGLDAADFQLVGENSGSHVPAAVSFLGGFAVMLRYADLPEDDYTLTLRGGAGRIEDLAGNDLAGGNFQVRFSADATVDRFREPLVAVSPLGSLVYQSSLTARINHAGDSDTIMFDPPAGAAITIVAHADTPLAASVVLRGPADTPLASAAMSPTGDAVLTTITESVPGSYSVTVGDAMSMPGRYSIRLLVNAAVEDEAHGGPANDSPAAAQDLTTSFLDLFANADRSALLGSISAGASDWFRFALADGQAASVALANVSAGDVTLQAYDSGLNLLATGAIAGNADRVINRLLDSTTNQALDTYYLRIAGAAAGDYSLLVTREAAFDTEGNNRPATAQDIGSTNIVLGHLARPDTSGPIPLSSGSPETPVAVPPPTTTEDFGPSTKPPYVPGRLLVRFAETASAADVAGSIGADDGTIRQHLPLINAAVVELPDATSDIRAAAASWASRPSVLYAEPDYVYHLDTTLPNDLFFARQLGVHNIGGIGGIADSDIDAPQAWDVINRSPGVVIAHIDSGVDYTHPDLAANIWTNPREIAGDGIDNDGNGYIDDVHGIDAVNNDSDPFDDNGHGTHTAGIIGAIGNNGLGVAGVSWGIQIMPLKLTDVDGEAETSNAVTLLNYAVRMKTQYGIKIVASNNSWGGPNYSQALRDAIAAANAAGIMIVASAGNNGRDNDVSPHYPSSYDLPGVIAVAATDKNDTLGSFQNYSNYGITTVDLAAPGTTILSTLPGGDYGYLTGTSMAAPHVTGAVAMLAALDPGASLAEIKEVLLSGSDPNPTSAGKTVSGGRLNLANSFALWSDDYYRFEVAAGQSLTIRTLTPDILPADSSNLDPALALFSPSGELLAADDNSDPDGRNALLSFVAPQSGSYTIRVSAISGQGDYVLTATQSAPVPAPSPAIAVAPPLPAQRRLAKEQASVGPGQAPSMRRSSPLTASRQASSAGALHRPARLLTRLRQKSVDRIVAELFDPLTFSNKSPS